MLDSTMATSFEPGTNLKGGVAGANWTFLLPRLDLARILCVGTPAAATLVTLARLGQEVLVLVTSDRGQAAVTALDRQHGLGGVRALRMESWSTRLPLPDGALDLVVLADSSALHRLGGPPDGLRELARVLQPEGLIYVESHGRIARPRRHPHASRWPGPGWRAERYSLSPLVGEMQTAVPIRDEPTISYFQAHDLLALSDPLGPLARVEGALVRHPRWARFARRTALLAARTETGLDQRPPAYLRAIAYGAGLEIDDWRWGLAAKGRYRSRKVLFFLFEPPSSRPTHLVKLTRDAALNPRLENAYHGLAQLWATGFGDPETLPQPVFLGHHGGLAVLAETVIDGEPFLARTAATADCPLARAAIDWLIRLGSATVDKTFAAKEVARCLDVLYERFSATYRLAPSEQSDLEAQLDVLRRISGAFPVVFQHGDPGPWNTLLTPSGRVAFIDWEAAERQGMPLWDLFYFLRAYSLSVARRAGTRGRLRGFGEQFLGSTALGELVLEATARYRAAVGLPAELVEPLFHTCWMHRALKEATRLPAGQLDQGHYIRLLRLGLERRDAPALRRLFQDGAL